MRKIVIDVNIWVSFGIGKRLAHLSEVLENSTIEIYSCEEMYAEFGEGNQKHLEKVLDRHQKAWLNTKYVQSLVLALK